MSGDQPVPPNRSGKVPTWAVLGGCALLVIGVCSITVGTLHSGKKDENVSLAVQQTRPTATAEPTSTPMVSEKPHHKKTSKAKVSVTTTTVRATTSPAKAATTEAKQKKKKAKPAPVTATTGTSYKLYNVVTGLCLGAMTNATTSTQQACSSAVTVKLELSRTVNGQPVYWVKTTDGSLCLDPSGTGAPSDGTEIGAASCYSPGSTDNQEWTLKNSGKVHDGRVEYYVINTLSQDCLDISGLNDGGDKPAGLKLTVVPCDPNDDHLWVFQAA